MLRPGSCVKIRQPSASNDTAEMLLTLISGHRSAGTVELLSYGWALLLKFAAAPMPATKTNANKSQKMMLCQVLGAALGGVLAASGAMGGEARACICHRDMAHREDVNNGPIIYLPIYFFFDGLDSNLFTSGTGLLSPYLALFSLVNFVSHC